MTTPLPPMGAADTHPWGRCPHCRADAVKQPPLNTWTYVCGAGYRWDEIEQLWVPNALCPVIVQ
jgi:hypothetical protein